VEITLSEAGRAELVRRTELPHRRSAEKARIFLTCVDGMSNARVARAVGVQAKTVGKWPRAFAAERMAGLEDAGWIGRPKTDLVLDDAERTQSTQWARQAKTGAAVSRLSGNCLKTEPRRESAIEERSFLTDRSSTAYCGGHGQAKSI
jgi:transposase